MDLSAASCVSAVCAGATVEYPLCRVEVLLPTLGEFDGDNVALPVGATAAMANSVRLKTR